MSNGNDDETKASRTRPSNRSTLLIEGTPKSATPDERVHYLVVVEGEEPGRRFRLGREPVLIGRTEPANLVLPDPKISRSHCRVGIVMNNVAVVDLNSTNGTFVDGERVDGAADLPLGASLQVGGHVLVHELRHPKEVEAWQELDRDLATAARYVQSLLPAELSDGPIRAEWLLRPSTKLGGDALGYRYLDDHRFAVYLIDVCGHGAGAAMHAVSVINVLRGGALPGTDWADPADVLTHLNAMFQMDLHADMYVTIWYGVFDRTTRRLSFSTGGHHPAFLVSAENDESIPLRTSNLMLGAVRPDRRFAADSVEVPIGSRLYVFSDGVFEITAAGGKQWGLDDLHGVFLRPAVPGLGEPRRIHRFVQAECGGAAFEDDFSIVVVQFL